VRVLIEVAAARGSTPREAGAWMVVGPEGAEGTIGGGRLEWEAMAAARAMLAAGEAAREMDVALGPEIGQCCGGRVRLRLTAAGPEAVAARRAAEAAALPQVWVFGAGHVGAALARALAALPVRTTVADGRAEALAALGARFGDGGSVRSVAPPSPRPSPASGRGGADGEGGGGLAGVAPGGAGGGPHPGPLPQGGRGGASREGGSASRAVAHEGFGASPSPHPSPASGRGGEILASSARFVSPPLAPPFAPPLPPAGEGGGEGFGPGKGVATLLTALPEAAIRGAEPGAAFVILTHDHALDFLLAAEALARGDAAYVGMIGSATKRAAFSRFARARGVDPGRLVCPIGGPSGDKRPAVIAALAAAEVMRALAAAPAVRRDGPSR
jgi:xanthine/CO dehydrogenase XdhC/CoxF family maturation factor